jgi:hypothetical protein
MFKLADFLAELPESEHPALANAFLQGLHQAGMVARCLTEVDRDDRHEGVVQLLAYRLIAVERLQAARELARRAGVSRSRRRPQVPPFCLFRARRST